MRRLSIAASLLAVAILPATSVAHSPSVIETDTASPADAIVLEDPTLSRAIGATIDQPGEIDWYRMDLQAGDPLIVGMTAPAAPGALAATFTLLGPGLPAAADSGRKPRRSPRPSVSRVPSPSCPRTLRTRNSRGPGLSQLRLAAAGGFGDGSYGVAVPAANLASPASTCRRGLREEFGGRIRSTGCSVSWSSKLRGQPAEAGT